MGTILPETFSALLAPFRPCFAAPSYRNFQAIVAGWVHCPGRRTVTAVALASGALSTRKNGSLGGRRHYLKPHKGGSRD